MSKGKGKEKGTKPPATPATPAAGIPGVDASDVSASNAPASPPPKRRGRPPGKKPAPFRCWSLDGDRLVARPQAGRSELDEELLTFVTDLLKLGLQPTAVRRMAGIPKTAWDNWMLRSRNQETSNPWILRFRGEVEAAKTVGQARCLKIIHEAMPKDWRAAAWVLERVDPATWNPAVRTKVEHSGSVGMRVDYSQRLPSPEQLQDQILAAAEQIRVSRGDGPATIPFTSSTSPATPVPATALKIYSGPNGHANGHANGSNGHANGHANGQKNGRANGKPKPPSD